MTLCLQSPFGINFAYTNLQKYCLIKIYAYVGYYATRDFGTLI